MPGKNSRFITVKLRRANGMSSIPLPFDPKEVFGKVRAPVRVTLNGYTYRSTIFSMGGSVHIPLRKSHREAAGLDGDETVTVKIAADEAERSVDIPADLARAFRAKKDLKEHWNAFGYTARREYAEALTGAKKPETRERRLAGIVKALAARPKPR
ncbi:MAG TPA: YdeI/OmpD-associated family protein [Steroidobacteraceae bacterium]|jgi:hypothetical protein|nr:YdeI/OmpD-associated family protein [Steroidobacteraceae bacterium]